MGSSFFHILPPPPVWREKNVLAMCGYAIYIDWGMYNITYTLLHELWFNTSFNGTGHYLLQQHSHYPGHTHTHTHAPITQSWLGVFGSLFIRDESPEVYLEVVGVHLHLLQTVLAKGPQTHTLQQSLLVGKQFGVCLFVCLFVCVCSTLRTILMIPVTMESLKNSTVANTSILS